MIDAKRLAELMQPGSLRFGADQLSRMGTTNDISMADQDTLDCAAAVLREVAKKSDSRLPVRDVIPGSDDDVNGGRDDLLDAMALGVATLLRSSGAAGAANRICDGAAHFLTARQTHAKVKAEIEAE
jgi:hypothetical protein